MKVSWLVIAVAALSVIAADAAVAKPRKAKHVRPACIDRPYEFSWNFLLPGNRAPQPNGCSPAVYQYGRYIGQDRPIVLTLNPERQVARVAMRVIERVNETFHGPGSGLSGRDVATSHSKYCVELTVPGAYRLVTDAELEQLMLDRQGELVGRGA